jgi:hypothetical protein
MKVTDFTRKALAVRRDIRDMEAAGYHRTEVDYRLHRGSFEDQRRRLEDVRIAADGKHVWYKISDDRSAGQAEREKLEQFASMAQLLATPPMRSGTAKVVLDMMDDT